MKIRTLIALLAVFASPTPGARAQHGAAAPPLNTTAPGEARQFDFLVGQWEIVAEPQVSFLVATFHGQPKLPGSWKAWRGLDGFGIEDEMRLTDRIGNPAAFTHCVRIFDRASRHWSTTTLDVYRTRFQPATAEWKGGQMVARAQATGDDGKPFTTRSRFYDITPNSFRWEQQHSYDGGRTWEDPTLKIEARRVAAAAPR